MNAETFYFYKVFPPSKNSNAEVITIRAFKDHEYSNFIKDKENIRSFLSSIDLLDAFSKNLIDLTNYTNNKSIQFKDNLRNIYSENITLNVSRLFLNTLSMFRSFIDFSNKSISFEYGKDSEEYNIWKEKQSEIFDCNFEYRFFSKMRNYTQHVGFPPIEITLSSTIDNPLPQLKISLKRNDLLEHKDIWKSKIYNEIRNCNELLPLFPMLKSLDSCLVKLLKTLLSIKSKRAIASSKRILNYRFDFKLFSGQELHYGTQKDNGNKEFQLKLLPLPEREATHILDIKI